MDMQPDRDAQSDDKSQSEDRGTALKLVFATPAYRRQVDVEHVVQAMALCNACAADRRFRLFGFSYADSYCLDWSRNRLRYGALRQGADWLLLIDADTCHRNAAETLRMILTGQERGAAVIAAPVRMRGRNRQYNVRARQGDDYFIVDETYFRGRVLEVDAVGTAFMALRCAWFSEHFPAQPWFETAHLPGEEPRSRSEDLNFCQAVKSRGGAIFVDGRFNPLHIGAELSDEPGRVAWADV